jgi:hypothetical protein
MPMPDISDMTVGLASLAMLGWVVVTGVNGVVKLGQYWLERNGNGKDKRAPPTDSVFVSPHTCKAIRNACAVEKEVIKDLADSDRGHLQRLQQAVVKTSEAFAELKVESATQGALLAEVRDDQKKMVDNVSNVATDVATVAAKINGL